MEQIWNYILRELEANSIKVFAVLSKYRVIISAGSFGSHEQMK